MSAPVDRQSIHAELERARWLLHDLASGASPADLRRRTTGTRWTNQQMLFHMVFGYMIVLRLLWLVRVFGRLPDGYSRRFARTLNAARRPFHVVNYLGSCGGAMVFHDARLEAQANRVITVLHRRLDRETDESLARHMHFPVDWDPFFRETMTLLDVYHYGTEHFDFHAHQLTLPTSEPGPRPSFRSARR